MMSTNMKIFIHHLKADLQLPGLKISHINVNGLLNKLLDIKALLFSINFDILAITESHLSEDISDDEIAITGYKTARRDRNDGRKGGGTVIYFAEYLDAYERQDIDVNNSLEAAWIDVTVASQRLLVASMYRPPDNTTFWNQFSSTLDRIWMKRTNVISILIFCQMLRTQVLQSGNSVNFWINLI